MPPPQSAPGGNDLNGDTTDAAFQHTITWGGPGFILSPDGSGTPGNGFTVQSALGFNYKQPFAPEPSTFVLMGAELCAAGLIRRKRVR